MPNVQCDQCDRQFTVPAEYAGQKVQCPNCRAYARVPVPPVVVSHPALTGLRYTLWVVWVLAFLILAWPAWIVLQGIAYVLFHWLGVIFG